MERLAQRSSKRIIPPMEFLRCDLDNLDYDEIQQWMKSRQHAHSAAAAQQSCQGRGPTCFFCFGRLPASSGWQQFDAAVWRTLPSVPFQTLLSG